MTSVHEVPTRGARIRHVIATERFRWGLTYALLTLFAATRAASGSERDPYWSARAGLEYLDGAPLARPDVWSWSAEGLWYPNSPAWNVVLGLGWQWLGYWGLFWVAFIAMTLLLGLALFLARSAGARALPTLVVFIPMLLASSSALSARATVVVQALILVSVAFAWWWGSLAERLRLGIVGSAVAVGIAGFALSVIGNWVHLSFMLLTAAIAVMWALAWWLTPARSVVWRLVLTATGTVGLFLGCVASPYGIGLTLERSQIVNAICRDIISEWTSIVTAVQDGEIRWVVAGAIALGAAAGCIAWLASVIRRDGRFDPRVRLTLPLVVLGVPMVLVGLGTLRFLVVGLLVLLPVAAAAGTGLVDRIRRAQLHGKWTHPKVVEYTSGRFWTIILIGIGLVLTPVGAVAVAQGAKPPEADLAKLLPNNCFLWSDASAAGPIILTRPDVKVWIDGRADFYGREHLLEYIRIWSADEPLPEQTNCVILPSEFAIHFPLADVLDNDSDWSRVATNQGYVLWTRE